MSIMSSLLMRFDARVNQRNGGIEIDMDLAAKPIGTRWAYDPRYKCVAVVYRMSDGTVVPDKKPGVLDQRGIYRIVPFTMNPSTQEVQ